MRQLRSDADLSDLPLPLRQEVADCLKRWAESGVPYAPEDVLVALVEPGDTVDAVASYLSGAAGGDGEDSDLPAEWTTDRGCAYESFCCWSDDGFGVSLITPKVEGIDPLLLELLAAYAAQQPALT